MTLVQLNSVYLNVIVRDRERPGDESIVTRFPNSHTEAGLRIANVRFLKREDMRLLIFNKDTGQFIGSSGLHNPNWEVPKFEIGYWIDSRFRGNGYITEAVQGISTFAFNELKARRLEIRCDSLNLKSRAIPERLGFALEGTLRNDDISADGHELRDTAVYAKIR